MDTEQYRAVRESIGRKAAIVADNARNTDHNGRPTRPREPIPTGPQKPPPPPAAEQAPPAWAIGTAAAATHLDVALGQHLDDPRDVIAELDLEKYLNADRTVNMAAVKETADKYQAIADQEGAPTPAEPPPPPNLGQGNVGAPPKRELSQQEARAVKTEHVQRAMQGLEKLTDDEVIAQMRNRH